jgi:hypothetical protein
LIPSRKTVADDFYPAAGAVYRWWNVEPSTGPGLRSANGTGIRGRLPLLINNHLVIRYAQTVGARVAATGAVHRFLQLYARVCAFAVSIIQKNSGTGEERDFYPLW